MATKVVYFSVTVARERAPIYFCVFRLFKQWSSDNRVALEMKRVATF
jgi:hypothetical protein